MPDAIVIGAGLAGCEAAWQLAVAGFDVMLYEMKPSQMSPAHHSPLFAELVCSNSLKATRMDSASGVLKREMKALGSLILACAEKTSVPAGGALAVDREAFATLVTAHIRNHQHITVVEEEVQMITQHHTVIVATGPLTQGTLSLIHI